MKGIGAVLGRVVISVILAAMLSIPGAVVLMFAVGFVADIADLPKAALGFLECYIITVIIAVFVIGSVWIED